MAHKQAIPAAITAVLATARHAAVTAAVPSKVIAFSPANPTIQRAKLAKTLGANNAILPATALAATTV